MQCAAGSGNGVVHGKYGLTTMETYQVTEASSDALHEIYDGLSSLPTMNISDMIVPSTRKDIEDDEKINIPERSAQYIFEGKQFAFAAITSVHGDNALVVDGGATSTLTKSFDNCTQIRPKVVAIQTASGSTSINTSSHAAASVRHTLLLVCLENFG